jgi:hypothetical protein
MQDHLAWRGNLGKTEVGFLAHEIKFNFVNLCKIEVQ